MKNLTDRDYLLQGQYRDASNLRARIAIHQRFSTNRQGILRWFVEQLQIPEDGRVLEVGSGPGGYWPEIVPMIPDSWQITVSDFSPGMVVEARRRLAALGRPFTVVQADVQDLPFPDESFDGVIANFMLYHVPNRARALTEIHRVLAPGGRLFAMTNGKGHMQELDDLMIRVTGDSGKGEALGFSLENGAEQLAPLFDQIELARYPDTLMVTETEPLMAYLRSYLSGLSLEQEAALREELQREIDAHGAIAIGKDSGMLTGVRREPTICGKEVQL